MSKGFSTLGEVIGGFIVSPIIVFLICLIPVDQIIGWLDDLIRPLSWWIKLPILIPAIFLGPVMLFGFLLFLAGLFGPLIALYDFFTSNAEYAHPHSDRFKLVLVIVGVAIVGLNLLIVHWTGPRW